MVVVVVVVFLSEYYTIPRWCSMVRQRSAPTAVAADRRAVAYSSNRLPAGPTAANPPHAAAAVDRRDRRTDGRTEGHRAVT